MSNATAKKPQPEPVNNMPQVVESAPLLSQKFVADVEKQFAQTLGRQIAWTPLQSTLAQNLFLKIDGAFAAFRAKGTNIGWNNIDRARLAIDARRIVLLEIDATEKNSLHVIPYLNGKTGLYDIDLRLGFVGYKKSRVRFAEHPVVDVVTRLIYETDQLLLNYKGASNEIESYDYKQTNPFNPGKVVGGLGYIAYEDPRRNKLVVVTMRDFERSRKAGNRDFWGWDEYEDSGTGRTVAADEKSRIEMMEKTVVFRTSEQIPVDTSSIYMREAFEWVALSALETAEHQVNAQIAANANGELIAMTPSLPAAEEPVAAPAKAPEPKSETKPKAEAKEPESPREVAERNGAGIYKDPEGRTRSTETGDIVGGEQPAQPDLGGGDY